jgi:hypothetical protein
MSTNHEGEAASAASPDEEFSDEFIAACRELLERPLDELQALFDRPDVVDTLGLAVLAARAFEVMLDRWCGLGVWEYRTGYEAGEHGADITTEIDVAYSLSGRTGAATFHFSFPTTVSM